MSAVMLLSELSKQRARRAAGALWIHRWRAARNAKGHPSNLFCDGTIYSRTVLVISICQRYVYGIAISATGISICVAVSVVVATLPPLRLAEKTGCDHWKARKLWCNPQKGTEVQRGRAAVLAVHLIRLMQSHQHRHVSLLIVMACTTWLGSIA